MNKIERLTGIVFILGRKSKVQAKELAELFEVSERTIYRDIQALSELQVPVIAETGTCGGYRMAADYFLHPVVFTENESQALFLGGQFIRNQQGFPLAKPAALALEKLAAVMTPSTLSAALALTAKISYNIPVNSAATHFSQILAPIKQAMESHHTVEILYQTLHASQATWRKVDIYRLFFEEDAWHVMGFCHLRQEVRQFKVARIKNLNLTEQTFEMENWQPSSASTPQPEPTRVKVTKNTPTWQKLKENASFQSFIQNEDDENLYLSFPAEWFSPEYLIETVLGFGNDAEIVSPEKIRVALTITLQAMLGKYQ